MERATEFIRTHHCLSLSFLVLCSKLVRRMLENFCLCHWRNLRATHQRWRSLAIAVSRVMISVCFTVETPGALAHMPTHRWWIWGFRNMIKISSSWQKFIYIMKVIRNSWFAVLSMEALNIIRITFSSFLQPLNLYRIFYGGCLLVLLGVESPVSV